MQFYFRQVPINLTKIWCSIVQSLDAYEVINQMTSRTKSVLKYRIV